MARKPQGKGARAPKVESTPKKDSTPTIDSTPKVDPTKEDSATKVDPIPPHPYASYPYPAFGEATLLIEVQFLTL